MHNYYIINGKVEFHPATSTLKALDEPENVIDLNSPAGRCFLLLIQRQGHIVSQTEMMDEVWVKSGILVSSNTYYQNISILRKGLKRIGFDEEIVVTIPRIGLTLASDVSIEKKNTEPFLNVETLPSEHVDKNGDDENITNNEEGGVFNPPSAVITSDQIAESTTSLPHTSSSLSWQNVLQTLLIAIGIIFLLLSGLKIYHHRTPDGYYINFVNIESPGNCKIFVYPWDFSAEDRINALSYAKKFTDSCDQLPYIYIDSNPLLPRVSVIRCPSPVGQPGRCLSDYFILDK